jgi:hypothetical protein
MPRKVKTIEQNPFLSTFLFETKWVLDTQRGYESLEVDIEPNVKLYPTLAALLPTLTSTELKLLSYILLHYPEATYVKGEEPVYKDYIELTPKSLGVAESSFHKAKAGLIIAGILSPRMSRQSTYWLNPKMLFKGNRVKLYSKSTVAVNKDPLEELKNRNKPRP